MPKGKKKPKSVSKTQKRLMGWALACKTGKQKNCPTSVQKVADTMKKSDLESMAKTKNGKLPEEIKERRILSFSSFVENIQYYEVPANNNLPMSVEEDGEVSSPWEDDEDFKKLLKDNGGVKGVIKKIGKLYKVNLSSYNTEEKLYMELKRFGLI